MNHPRQAIKVTFINPTNDNLTPRFRAKCSAGSLVRECDDDVDHVENAHRTAIALCEKLGWDPSMYVVGGLDNDGYVYVDATDVLNPRPSKRWTLGPGKVLAIDGVDALAISLERDAQHNSPISPATADDIASDVCAFLNRREATTPTKTPAPANTGPARAPRSSPLPAGSGA